MNYDIFISYEISDSSFAYELAAVLSRNNVTYYLDCVNSGVTMSGYVEGILKDCRLIVPLVSARYLHERYACEQLSCAIGMGKQVLVCFTDDCVLPAEFADFIPDGNRVSISGGREEVWNAVSRLLLAQGEEKISEENVPEEFIEESQEESLLPTIEDVSELESGIEAIAISEEKKRAIANLLCMLRTYREENEGYIRCYKPEPPKTVMQDRVETKNEGNKPLVQGVRDLILLPFRIVWALFLMLFAQKPLFTICAVIYIVLRCCSMTDDGEKIIPPQQKFTEEQIAEGKRINKLGTDYYYGRDGVEKDRAKALEYYEQAAELGNADATYNVGMCAKLGMGCRKDLDVASYYYYRAAKLGHERAFDELKALAEAGDAKAQNRYGICFEYGYCTKIILKNAVYWYDQAAKQGNSYGQYNLGQCYYRGRGVKQNERVACQWFRKAADGGNASAQYELGLCYLDGLGVAQDSFEAFSWLSKAAAQDHVDALNELAYCYAQGIGTYVNISMAHATIDKAIQIDPDDANLYDSKGEFYVLVGDKVNALKMYKKVLETNSAFYVHCTWSKLYDYINNQIK